jgi:HlyD family secretion protein
VSESDIGLVRVGQTASFEVLSFPGRTFTAKVERLAVDPRREAGVVTYSVRLLAENPDQVLLPGMSATVKLEVARVDHVLSVRDAALRFMPADADATQQSEARVYLRVGPAELRAVPVSIGLSDGMYTAITPREGQRLGEGDAVAVGVLHTEAAARSEPGISLGGK